MDHLINAMKPFLEAELSTLAKEWRSRKYKKMSDCPSYSSCNAIVKAIHTLEINCYGKKQTMSVKELIEL